MEFEYPTIPPQGFNRRIEISFYRIDTYTFQGENEYVPLTANTLDWNDSPLDAWHIEFMVT